MTRAQVATCSTRGAHLLRRAPACYNWRDLGSDKAVAVELGKASARREGT